MGVFTLGRRVGRNDSVNGVLPERQSLNGRFDYHVMLHGWQPYAVATLGIFGTTIGFALAIALAFG